MKMPRIAAALFAVVLVSLAPASSRATPNFPTAIETDVPAPAPPPCQICHVGPQQLGTVRTAFGTSMRARGLVAFDEGSLKAALAQMAIDKVDSDGDGVTDIDALKAGKDPNGSGGAVAVGPQYGCSAHGGRDRVSGGLQVMMGVLVAMAMGRRRKRRVSSERPRASG